MKRLIPGLALAFALTAPASLCLAQESPEKAGEHQAGKAHETHEEGGLELWKWANFLVLVGGLGYLIGKNAGPFFAARSAAIRRDMEEALRERQAAEARAAAVDRRLATLETEIAAVRSEGEHELQTVTERLTRQTTAEIAKIQVHAGQEIETAGKQARSELKRYSAELAMGLAEQKVRARMTPGAQDALVDSFVRDLK